MKTATKRPARKPHEMVAVCVCGSRFHKAADTLAEVTDAHNAWYAEHASCRRAA